jgi:hypothetical protein
MVFLALALLLDRLPQFRIIAGKGIFCAEHGGLSLGLEKAGILA